MTNHLGDPAYRLSFRFSADATHAACLAPDRQGHLRIEAWTFDSRVPTARLLPAPDPETIRTQPVPAPDGRVLLVRNGAGTHRVAVAGLDQVHPVADFACPGLRAFPSRDAATLAWLVAYHRPDRSVIHRVDAATLAVEPAIELPGLLTGEGWWSDRADLLVANHLVDGRSCLVEIDLGASTIHPLAATVPGARPGGRVAALLASPARGTVLLGADTAAGVRLGWLSRDTAEIDVPTALNELVGAVRPLALSPAGDRLALRVSAGAADRLLVYEVEADAVHTAALPPGVIRAAGWGPAGLHVLCSSPTRPAYVSTVDQVGTGWGTRSGPAAPDPRFHDARREVFAGPAGPIEAVVYGPDRRRTRHLLVALHGGPQAAWDLAFDPVFQRFAAAGITVVAPNQRGSTGYGAAHRDALDGAWGGPDLADIGSLLGALRRDNPAVEPMLFGVSYGAFLALLAAAADPHAWSRCVAVAPFLSAALLHGDGSQAVRMMLDRLGALVPVRDDLGPRDLLRLAPRIRARLLVLHGGQDDVIPVRHSRLLARALRAAGRRSPRDFTYREVPAAGHNPLAEPGGDALLESMVTFLTADRPRAAAPARDAGPVGTAAPSQAAGPTRRLAGTGRSR